MPKNDASSGPSLDSPSTAPPHRAAEDVIALVIGSLAMSFGVILLQQVGAVAGGLAGVAFLISYSSGWPFGVAFFIINIPFYVLSFLRMGWLFTLKTACVVVLISVFTGVHGSFITIGHIGPFYACAIGGMFMGMGMLILFRHRASAGGLGILALYLQERVRLSAGLLLLAFDAVIVLAALLVADVPIVLASAVGVVVLNVILAMNHRPGRYAA